MASTQATIDLVVRGSGAVNRLIEDVNQLESAVNRINSRSLEVATRAINDRSREIARRLEAVGTTKDPRPEVAARVDQITRSQTRATNDLVTARDRLARASAAAARAEEQLMERSQRRTRSDSQVQRNIENRLNRNRAAASAAADQIGQLGARLRSLDRQLVAIQRTSADALIPGLRQLIDVNQTGSIQRSIRALADEFNRLGDSATPSTAERSLIATFIPNQVRTFERLSDQLNESRARAQALRQELVAIGRNEALRQLPNIEFNVEGDLGQLRADYDRIVRAQQEAAEASRENVRILERNRQREGQRSELRARLREESNSINQLETGAVEAGREVTRLQKQLEGLTLTRFREPQTGLNISLNQIQAQAESLALVANNSSIASNQFRQFTVAAEVASIKLARAQQQSFSALAAGLSTTGGIQIPEGLGMASRMAGARGLVNQVLAEMPSIETGASSAALSAYINMLESLRGLVPLLSDEFRALGEGIARANEEMNRGTGRQSPAQRQVNAELSRQADIETRINQANLTIEQQEIVRNRLTQARIALEERGVEAAREQTRGLVSQIGAMQSINRAQERRNSAVEDELSLLEGRIERIRNSDLPNDTRTALTNRGNQALDLLVGGAGIDPDLEGARRIRKELERDRIAAEKDYRNTVGLDDARSGQISRILRLEQELNKVRASGRDTTAQVADLDRVRNLLADDAVQLNRRLISDASNSLDRVADYITQQKEGIRIADEQTRKTEKQNKATEDLITKGNTLKAIQHDYNKLKAKGVSIGETEAELSDTISRIDSGQYEANEKSIEQLNTLIKKYASFVALKRRDLDENRLGPATRLGGGEQLIEQQRYERELKARGEAEKNLRNREDRLERASGYDLFLRSQRELESAYAKMNDMGREDLKQWSEKLQLSDKLKDVQTKIDAAALSEREKKDYLLDLEKARNAASQDRLVLARAITDEIEDQIKLETSSRSRSRGASFKMGPQAAPVDKITGPATTIKGREEAASQRRSAEVILENLTSLEKQGVDVSEKRASVQSIINNLRSKDLLLSNEILSKYDSQLEIAEHFLKIENKRLYNTRLQNRLDEESRKAQRPIYGMGPQAAPVDKITGPVSAVNEPEKIQDLLQRARIQQQALLGLQIKGLDVIQEQSEIQQLINELEGRTANLRDKGANLSQKLRESVERELDLGDDKIRLMSGETGLMNQILGLEDSFIEKREKLNKLLLTYNDLKKKGVQFRGEDVELEALVNSISGPLSPSLTRDFVNNLGRRLKAFQSAQSRSVQEAVAAGTFAGTVKTPEKLEKELNRQLREAYGLRNQINDLDKKAVDVSGLRTQNERIITDLMKEQGRVTADNAKSLQDQFEISSASLGGLRTEIARLKSELVEASKATGFGKSLQDFKESLQGSRTFFGDESAAQAIDKVVREFNKGTLDSTTISGDGAAAAAENVSKTFASSIKGGVGSMVSATKSVFNQVTQTINDAFGIASPSRFIIKLVQNLASTYISQLEREYPGIKAATQRAFGDLPTERPVRKLVGTERGFEFVDRQSTGYRPLPDRSFEPLGAGSEMDEMLRQFRYKIAQLTTQPEIYRNILNALPSSMLTTDLAGLASERARGAEMRGFMDVQRRLGPGELERYIQGQLAEALKGIRIPNPWIQATKQYQEFALEVEAQTQQLSAVAREIGSFDIWGGLFSTAKDAIQDLKAAMSGTRMLPGSQLPLALPPAAIGQIKQYGPLATTTGRARAAIPPAFDASSMVVDVIASTIKDLDYTPPFPVDLPAELSQKRNRRGDTRRVISEAIAEYRKAVENFWSGEDSQFEAIKKIVVSSARLSAAKFARTLQQGSGMVSGIKSSVVGADSDYDPDSPEAMQRAGIRLGAQGGFFGIDALTTFPSEGAIGPSSRGEQALDSLKKAVEEFFNGIKNSVNRLTGGGAGLPPRPPGGPGGGAGGAGDPGDFGNRLSDAEAKGAGALLSLQELQKPSEVATARLELLSNVLKEIYSQLSPTSEEGKKFNKALRETTARLDEIIASRAPDADPLLRLTQSPRLAQGISEGLIGGAFPLLFGQGAGAAVFGGLGGFAGGFAGGSLGFGLSLIGTSLGTLFDTAVASATELGGALNDLSTTFDTVKERSLFSSRELEEVASKLEEAGLVATASVISQQELIEKIGGVGVQRLRSLEAASDRLGRAWAELNVQLQSALVGPMAGLLEWVAKIVAESNKTGRKEAQIEDIRALLPAEGRERLDNMFVPGPGARQIMELFGGNPVQDKLQLAKALARLSGVDISSIGQDQVEVPETRIQQEISILEKELEAINIADGLKNQFKEVGKQQQDIEKQVFEARKQYEDSIADIRLNVERTVQQQTLDNLRAQNELYQVQGQIRLQALSNANQSLVSEQGTNDYARRLFEILGQAAELELSTQQDIENRRRQFELEIQSQEIETAIFKGDIAKQVAKLNEESERRIADIRKSVRETSERYDVRRFEIEKRTADLRLALMEEEVKNNRQNATTKLEQLGPLSAANADSVIFFRQQLDLANKQQDAIKSSRKTIAGISLPPATSPIEVGRLSLQGVSTAAYDSARAGALAAAKALLEANNQLAQLAKEGKWQEINDQLISIADQGYSSVRDELNTLVSSLAKGGDQYSYTIKRIAEATMQLEEAEKALGVGRSNRIVDEYRKEGLDDASIKRLLELGRLNEQLSLSNIEAARTAGFFVEAIGLVGSEIKTLQDEMREATRSGTALDNAMRELAARGLSPASEEAKKLIEQAQKLDILKGKAQVLEVIKFASEGLTDSFKLLIEQSIELKNEGEAVKEFAKNLGKSSLSFVLDLAFKPLEETMRTQFLEFADKIGIKGLRTPAEKQLEELTKANATIKSIEGQMKNLIPKAPPVAAAATGQTGVGTAYGQTSGPASTQLGLSADAVLLRSPQLRKYLQAIPADISKNLSGLFSNDLIINKAEKEKAAYIQSLSAAGWNPNEVSALSPVIDEIIFKAVQKRLQEVSRFKGQGGPDSMLLAQTMRSDGTVSPIPEDLVGGDGSLVNPSLAPSPVPVYVVPGPGGGAGLTPLLGGSTGIDSQAVQEINKILQGTTGAIQQVPAELNKTTNGIKQSSTDLGIANNAWLKGLGGAVTGLAGAAAGVLGISGGIQVMKESGTYNTLMGLAGIFGGIASVAGSFSSLGKSFGGSSVPEAPPPPSDPGAPAAPRAAGGPVFGNNPYLVGEQGPELFIPSGNGMIIPNHVSISGAQDFEDVPFTVIPENSDSPYGGEELSDSAFSKSAADDSQLQGSAFSKSAADDSQLQGSAFSKSAADDSQLQDSAFSSGVSLGAFVKGSTPNDSTKMAESISSEMFKRMGIEQVPFTKSVERISAERLERETLSAINNPSPIDIRYESQVINQVEYVTAEQHRKGMSQAAERGRALALDSIQNSVKARRKIGMA